MFRRWEQVCGYKEVLAIGLPLVVSMGSTTVMQFTDRMFLSHYSLETIAAAMPASVTSFLFISFFMGVAGYVNVFVAQYIGAGRGERVGASLWQGIYFALFAWVVLAGIGLLAEPLFRFAGHPEEVFQLEVAYFSIVMYGAGVSMVSFSLSTFFSGRGITRPAMVVNLIAAGINIPLDYAMINGAWGMPEMGIEGAATATVIAWTVGFVLYAYLVFTKKNEKQFKVRTNRAFDWSLFKRLMRFGLPGGVQFFTEIAAITFFAFMIGRLGKVELAATNIVFSIETLGFLPMVGFHVAVQTMVGQAIGRNRPDQAVRATYNTLHITLAYMGMMAFMFLVLPDMLMNLFKPDDISFVEYTPTKETGIVLLRFVAVFCMFDALSLIYSGAIKGAGDIVFVMKSMALSTLVTIFIPLSLGYYFFDIGIYSMWVLLTLFAASLGVVFYLRFKQGAWKAMRVIEEY